ncbi:MAG: allophanate hydrolase [Nitriliruptoraceae bacterium]|nr:allophanate hydrolase [Nitriliruptoraceae bacterium]
MTAWQGGLDAVALRTAYERGQIDPVRVVEEVFERIEARGDDHVWIDRRPLEQVRADAQQLMDGRLGAPQDLPLYGLPFAVKDNIDVAGRPTTAACPDFAAVASVSATVVDRLVAAGAILIGKTNLDQFATGLVGTRSPYGAVGSAFDPRDIAGGSSSGSAVAVAADLVSFALGTDTAGSGRVPAGCNNVVGLKPTPGTVPTTGVVPACRSLDVVSVFALTVPDALAVLAVMAGPDERDAYVVRELDLRDPLPPPAAPRPRIGVPDELEFLGDADVEAVYRATIAQLRDAGVHIVEVPFAPLQAVASLLYDGPWVAERRTVLEDVLAERPEILHPVTRSILEAAGRYSATDAYRAAHRLQELRAQVLPVIDALDALVVPTAPTTFTIAQVEADPVARNSALGHYTNFVNLLGLAALAVPAGIASSGRPVGVTLIGPGGSDRALAGLGQQIHARAGVPLGATGRTQPAPRTSGAEQPRADEVALVVVGAHLRGQPLHHQLVEHGSRFLRATTTAAHYRLFALDGGGKPGMVRDADRGAALDVEVHAVPCGGIGALASLLEPPLGFGRIELADGRWELGFLAEPWGVEGTEEITHLGGWRQHLARR